MALRFNFQRELGSTSVAMCVKMEMKIVATSHRIWFSLPEHPSDPNKQAVDCLAVSVSAMDLSQSSSNPLLVRPQKEDVDLTEAAVLPETCDGVKVSGEVVRRISRSVSRMTG